jgi:hypothetical protein
MKIENHFGILRSQLSLALTDETHDSNTHLTEAMNCIFPSRNKNSSPSSCPFSSSHDLLKKHMRESIFQSSADLPVIDFGQSYKNHHRLLVQTA